MADIDSQLRKSIEESIQANRNINREMSQAIKTVTKFTDALDVASNTAIDKSTDSLKQLLKTSKLLSDSQVDTIKSAKGLQNVVESLGRKQARLDELQEQYNKQLEKAIAKGYAGVRLQRIEAALQQRLAKRLNDLGVSTASAANASAKLQDELTKHKDLEKQLNKEIVNLTSSASKAGKAVEDLGSRMVETAEKHLSVAAALGLLQKSLTDLYGQVTRFADKGMFAAWRAINMGALRLKLSVAEFEEVMARNMDIINSLGGGIAGIDSFTEALKSASKDLEMYGKNSAKIAAAIMGTVQRSTGLGPGSRDSNASREAYAQIQKSMKEQFKLFNGGFGDSIEQFTSYYDQVLRSEELQSKMNGLDSKSIANMVTEIQIRTENLKLMGLNNDQILEMTRRMEQMFPRLQNNQGEAIFKGINASNATALLGQYVQSQGLGELGARLQSKEYTDYAKKLRMSSGNAAANLKGTQLGIQYDKDIAEAVAKIERDRDKDESGAQGSFKGYAAYAAINNDRQFFDASIQNGTNFNIAKRSGQDHTEGSYTDKDGRIVGGAADKFRKDIKDMSGEASLLGKSFSELRSAVDQITSIINGGNGFVMALGAAAGAALLFSSALRGKVLSAITSLGSALMNNGIKPAIQGAGAGAGAAGAGAAGGAAGGLMSRLKSVAPKAGKLLARGAGALASALAASEVYQAYQAYERGDIDENERNKRIGAALGGAGGSIAGGVVGGAAGTLASPGVGTVAGGVAGGAAGGVGGSKAGEWIGGKFGEKGKYKTKKFNGFGSDVDSYIKEASTKYGIDEKTLRGFVKMEAGWNGQMSPTGAIGTGQFTQGTWNDLAKSKEGQNIGMKPITSSNFRTANDPRYDKRVNTLATGLLAKQNFDRLKRDGVATTGENLYMLHNIGPGVIPALKGSNNVHPETLKAMRQNGKKDDETPVEFANRQRAIFNTHYASANSITPDYKQTTAAVSPTTNPTPSSVNTKTIAPPPVAGSPTTNPTPSSVNTKTIAPPPVAGSPTTNPTPSSVNPKTIAPPPVAGSTVNTSPVTSLTAASITPPPASLKSPTNTISPTSPVAADMASAIVPLLEKIAENTTPSIVYNQKNYKPSQDTVLGTM